MPTDPPVGPRNSPIAPARRFESGCRLQSTALFLNAGFGWPTGEDSQVSRKSVVRVGSSATTRAAVQQRGQPAGPGLDSSSPIRSRKRATSARISATSLESRANQSSVAPGAAVAAGDRSSRDATAGATGKLIVTGKVCQDYVGQAFLPARKTADKNVCPTIAQARPTIAAPASEAC